MDSHGFEFNWLELPGKQRLIDEALLFQFSQTEKFSSEEIARLQFYNLKNLVKHCIEHVPYYQCGAYTRVESWEDWSQLPILSRACLQENTWSLHAENDLRSREGKTFKKRSSGSTGRPVEVLTTERAQKYWQAITVRDHLWHQRDFSQTLAVIKYLEKGKGKPPGQKSKYWGASSGLLYSTGPAVTINSSTDINRQYQWLREMDAGYLLTYPSLLRVLAEQNLASGQPIQLLGITTMGENLSPETREIAQRAFQGRVCDMYSCQEIGYLALQCPKHDHYHVQAETCLVEILDENGQFCAPGEMGRVIVTHLHNYCMPLIRYEIGDYAIAGGRCDCGINLPVLERVIGRERNLVSYPDGTKSWPSYNPMKLMGVLPNVQYQLVQKKLNTLLVRIGTAEEIPEAILGEVTKTINDAMGFTFNIEYEQVEAIPRSDSGKYEEFVSEVI